MWTILLGSGPETLGRQEFWRFTASLPIEAAIMDFGQVIAPCRARRVQHVRTHSLHAVHTRAQGACLAQIEAGTLYKGLCGGLAANWNLEFKR